MKLTSFTWALSLPLLVAPLAAQEQTSILDDFDFYGDFRLRAEFNDLSDSKDRHRFRMRFRAGVNYALDEEVSFGTRFVTGNPDDPNSTHVDLGDVMNSEMFTIDRLFVTYKPSNFETVAVDAGKFALRMQRNPVYGELVWDKDVQPEGIQATWGGNDFGFTAGEFQLIHQSKSNDSWMSWLQGWANFEMGEDSSLDTSLSFTYVGDPNPAMSTVIPDGDNSTNSETAGGQYLSDFGIVNAIVSGNIGGFAVAGEYILNVRADDSVGDSGYALGASYKQSNGNKAYYQYQLVEQDAVFTVLSGDDSLLGSNGSSHILGYKIPMSERSNVNIWMIASEWDEVPVGSSDDQVIRFRIDWNLEF